MGVLERGKNCNFNFLYKNSGNTEMIGEFWDSFLEILEAIPGGVLVVFSSYKQMNTFLEVLESKNFR